MTIPKYELSLEDLAVLQQAYSIKQLELQDEKEQLLNLASVKQVEIDACIKKIETLSSTIKGQFQAKSVQIAIPLNGYIDLPIPKKALHVLKDFNKATYISSVFDQMASYQPEWRKDKKMKKAKQAHVYSALKYMHDKKDTIYRFVDKAGYIKVAYLSWLDENGNLKAEHQ